MYPIMEMIIVVWEILRRDGGHLPTTIAVFFVPLLDIATDQSQLWRKT